jgi:hypothetical protein
MLGSMWEFIFRNKDWIFSGIGVSIVTLFATIFLKSKKKLKSDLKSNPNFKKNIIQNSSVTTLTGKEINFNQTIYNDVKNEVENKKDFIPIFPTPELEKAKDDYITGKYVLRTNIYAALINVSSSNIDSIVEIRHILDEIEDKYGTSQLETLQELRDMSADNIIEFVLNKEETSISPYTRINLTKKFYSTISSF